MSNAVDSWQRTLFENASVFNIIGEQNHVTDDYFYEYDIVLRCSNKSPNL